MNCSFDESAGFPATCMACGRVVRRGVFPIHAQCRSSTSDAPQTPHFRSRIGGPGTELKKILAGWPFYITASLDCSCNQVAALMDKWGADECEQSQNRDYVLAALRENAMRRGLPFLDAAGMLLIKRAIRNARKSLAQDLTPATCLSGKEEPKSHVDP